MKKDIVNEPIDKIKPKKNGIFILFIIIIFLISTILYSRFISTSGLIIKEYKIQNNNITDDFQGFKIVHISDIHYGRTVKEKELKNIVKQINLIKPDIVVLTGDLIDKDTILTSNDIEIISNNLNNIDAAAGKYAITGNHDYDFDEWAIIIENSNFINLNDTYDLIYKNYSDYILISGLSTNIYGNKSISEKMETTNTFRNSLNDTNQPIYNILLMHEPDFIDDFDVSKFNLILAGHTHNGQVRLPFIGAFILPPYGRKYYEEHYKLDSTDLYISSGIGTSSYNFRFFNKPSINLYRLIKN